MKNYVKEYRGHKVPEGAEEFGPINEDGGFDRELFYKNNGAMVFIPRGTFHGGEWRNTSTERKDLILLPEAPQEWNGEGLPPVGCECEIKCFYKSGSGWKKCYIVGSTKDDNHLVVHTYYDDELNFAVKHIGDVKFRPLKTQQEKDREAFIDSVNGVFSDGEFDRHDLVLIAARLFDAEFTAPKETDNE